MSYVEETLMPMVLAELKRLKGADQELIRRVTEVVTGNPTPRPEDEVVVEDVAADGPAASPAT